MPHRLAVLGADWLGFGGSGRRAGGRPLRARHVNRTTESVCVSGGAHRRILSSVFIDRGARMPGLNLTFYFIFIGHYAYLLPYPMRTLSIRIHTQHTVTQRHAHTHACALLRICHCHCVGMRTLCATALAVTATTPQGHEPMGSRQSAPACAQVPPAVIGSGGTRVPPSPRAGASCVFC
jgi:hypothetical protein